MNGPWVRRMATGSAAVGATIWSVEHGIAHAEPGPAKRTLFPSEAGATAGLQLRKPRLVVADPSSSNRPPLRTCGEYLAQSVRLS